MPSTSSIPVALSCESPPKAMDQKRFEELFDLTYLPHLTFDNWEVENYVRHKCARALKRGKVGELAQWLGKLHGKSLEEGQVPEIAIRWMGPQIGYGLFATRSYKAWEYIGEYTGVLRRRALLFPDINDYCFMYPKEWVSLKAFTIDSKVHGNYTRFINHSDTPNLESVAVLHDGYFHIIFRTIQEIPEGSQLTYDYGDIYWRKRKKLLNKV